MKPQRIEHIGIAVTDLEEAIKYWEDVMGLEIGRASCRERV